MRSLIIRSFHNDEIRFAFVHSGRLYTLMMKWYEDQSHWNLHSYDQELLNNPNKYRFVVQVLLADERVIDYLQKRKIDLAAVKCYECNNVILDS
ncbi:hypothetical protein [Alkalihalobacillus sp. AL-G]|uniref:hypothetical protein n=1 Tax=Alkalihalobacillus sp. AL-G TaxID=2926399 RepID=UPI00272B9FDF|nr:hypothetical protein [Alkalihalobacillus sp. AL-G]WLD91601.1 hypothetical protein MOJ78_11135 [Alkalihalobacillus sp. AL-G]